MTFFNKKTEVMQVEMTPYGRYLYSIGKFKPHSYEFIDEDILYKEKGSQESQESAENRIINETPRLKPIRNFITATTEEIPAPSRIEEHRQVIPKMDLRNPNIYCLGKSSYSSDKSPSIQVMMLKGNISSSAVVSEVDFTNEHLVQSKGGDINIPQVNVDFILNSNVLNELDTSNLTRDFASRVFDDGSYIDLTFEPLMIHIKEFGSFYEKENFELEFFEVLEKSELRKLKLQDVLKPIENDILVLDGELDEYLPGDSFFEEDDATRDYVDFYFNVLSDEEISILELCEVSEYLKVNDQFLDEELICPDQRTDRFDIYRTRVSPSDLEDCDD